MKEDSRGTILVQIFGKRIEDKVMEKEFRMIDSECELRILLTGGTGRLGKELFNLVYGIMPVSSSDFDIVDRKSVLDFVLQYKPHVIVHTAAYTDVYGAEKNKEVAWLVNVEGTRNIAEAAQMVGAYLIHISTDYVFNGETGAYKEDDPLGNVVNYYSLTKLVSEEAARKTKNLLIIRTSFRPREFAYSKAFDDVYTSQDYVDIIAPEIALIIDNIGKVDNWFKEKEFDRRILHIATERKSVYELAVRRKPDVLKASKSEANVILPDDVSLNTDRWKELKQYLLKDGQIA